MKLSKILVWACLLPTLTLAQEWKFSDDFLKTVEEREQQTVNQNSWKSKLSSFLTTKQTINVAALSYATAMIYIRYRQIFHSKKTNLLFWCPGFITRTGTWGYFFVCCCDVCIKTLIAKGTVQLLVVCYEMELFAGE